MDIENVKEKLFKKVNEKWSKHEVILFLLLNNDRNFSYSVLQSKFKWNYKAIKKIEDVTQIIYKEIREMKKGNVLGRKKGAKKGEEREQKREKKTAVEKTEKPKENKNLSLICINGNVAKREQKREQKREKKGSKKGRKKEIFLNENCEICGVTDEHMEKWKNAYPYVNIEAELRKMETWLLANPNRRPRSLLERFIVNWLTRSYGNKYIRDYMEKKEFQEFSNEKFMQMYENMQKKKGEKDNGNTRIHGNNKQDSRNDWLFLP